ncbi:sigma-70 family RNA polymerase sigma factor [Proteiniphilum sp.]|uniref:RNA polymerase sigma factor n=1 Tax=Proteiniphilum sp. TaxID=1926877 RepID=UPI00331C5124
MSDKELLDAISTKDKLAFEAFYARYNRLLYKWAYTRVADIELTEDCLQNFWLSVWEEPEKIKTDEQGLAKQFLLRCFTHRILNSIKKEMAGAFEHYPLSDEAKDSQPYCHVEEELNVQEIHSLIDRLLQELPETLKEVCTLRWRRDYSTKEIAVELKIDERTASYKVKDGLAILKKSLKKWYGDNEPTIKVLRDTSSSVIYIIFFADKIV